MNPFKQKFCRRCGAAIVEQKLDNGFNGRTGKPEYRKRRVCSSAKGEYPLHYNSDEEFEGDL